jgi:hypothetical protein
MPGLRSVSRHLSAPSLCFLYLLCFLGFSCFLLAQQRPADAAEISLDLLYHPARRIEFTQQGAIFRAAQFTYRFRAEDGRWEVAREKNADPDAGRAMKSYANARLGGELRFNGVATQNEGILELRRSDAPEPLARLTLWTRQQLAAAWPDYSREAPDFEPAEPEVAAVADDGTHLWLAIKYSYGEGWLGLGALVQFDPQTNEAKVYRPSELATSSISAVVAAGDVLWLGTDRHGEGSISPTAGLVRFNPQTAELRSYLPETSPLQGRIVTALATEGDLLWVATDAGICRITLPQEEWACWHISPAVHLAVPVAVASRPGGPARGRLPAGDYEVRWANAAFLEVITSDATDGWVATDDLQEYVRERFFTDAFELWNVYTGGAAPMRLLETPAGDPLSGAQVYRAVLERVGSPTPEGWQRVRARIGWISRGKLEVEPRVQAIKR